MDAVIVHLQQNWIAYTVFTVILLPVIFATRRYSLPLILWSIEVCIYLTALHLFLFGMVKAVVGFKYSTQMQWKEDEKVMETWSMPLTEFWRRDLYDPSWIFWLEIVFLIAVVAFILKYRPIRIQAPPPKRDAVRKGMGMTRSGGIKGPGARGSKGK